VEIRHIVGPPGTGKTRTITEQVQRYLQLVDPDTIYIMSLTKAAAREAAGRVEELANVGTIHSFAFRCLDAPKIAEAHIQEWNRAYPHWALKPTLSTIDDVTVDPRPSDTTDGDALMAQVGWLRATITSRDRWPGDVRQFFSAWQMWKTTQQYLDFTDLLEHCLLRRVPLSPRPKILLIDEAQDLSRLDCQVVEMWADGALLLGYVGDPDQCLYTFRGSDPTEIFPAVDRCRVLSQSYRIPIQVHQAALAWIRQMPGYRPYLYKSAAHSGVVEHLPFTYHDGRELVSLQQGHTVYLASCGYMLDGIIESLREQGIPYANPLKPNNGKWNPLAQRRGLTLAQRLVMLLKVCHGEPWTSDDVAAWVEPMLVKDILVYGQKSALMALGESDNIPTALQAAFVPGQEPPVSSPMALLTWWHQRLQSKHAERLVYPRRVYERCGLTGLIEPPGVHVGTIHSYKGGEIEHVVLVPDVSPAGRDQWEVGDTVPIYRTMYVGMTRAKQTLHITKAASYGVL
jgi:superfamily I DNA/RNA helicase